MHLLNLTLPNLTQNLALDEVLLLEADAGRAGECLRFWEWPTAAVVLGASGVLREEVLVDACTSVNVPILRRASGGGTVLLGPGCLEYSLVLSMTERPEMRSVTTSYRAIMGTMVKALQALVPSGSVHCAGSSDLAWDGRKFSGNAQKRGRHFILHHGTILYDFELTWIRHYLPLPPRQPEYRAGRSHEDFICNFPAPVEAIKKQLVTAWNADTPLTTWLPVLVTKLEAEKYGRPEWISRR
jgi:lipoate---protein ligase